MAKQNKKKLDKSVN